MPQWCKLTTYYEDLTPENLLTVIDNLAKKDKPHQVPKAVVADQNRKVV